MQNVPNFHMALDQRAHNQVVAMAVVIIHLAAHNRHAARGSEIQQVCNSSLIKLRLLQQIVSYFPLGK